VTDDRDRAMKQRRDALEHAAHLEGADDDEVWLDGLEGGEFVRWPDDDEAPTR
jgi:hypothetical protein